MTMNIGLLWYDDDKKRTLDEKVQRAVEFYQAKYGVVPTQCHIHPALMPADKGALVAGVKMYPNRTIIKNHFWLGVDEGVKRAKPAA